MDNRLHYMDHLRAGAMLLGIAFHGALAYASPIQEFWFIRDQSSSTVLNVVAIFLHTFRMPLFFLVSGYFSRLIVEKRGLKQFLKNRFLRILLPFLVFWPIIALVSLATLLFALEYLQETPPLLQFLIEQADTQTGGIGDIGALHLWFLYYLIYFGVVAAILHRLRIRRFDELINKLYAGGWLYVALPIIIAPALFQAGHPVPSPDRFGPMLWPFGYFGAFYALGWLTFGNEKALETLDASRVILIPAALAGFALYYTSLPEFRFPPAELPQNNCIQLSLLGAFSASIIVYLILSLGRQYLNIENPKVRYVADASYWLYLIHLPVVVFFQILVAEAPGFAWLKFLFVVVATTLFALLTYGLVVRRSFIGAFLNGRRRSN